MNRVRKDQRRSSSCSVPVFLLISNFHQVKFTILSTLYVNLNYCKQQNVTVLRLQLIILLCQIDYLPTLCGFLSAICWFSLECLTIICYTLLPWYKLRFKSINKFKRDLIFSLESINNFVNMDHPYIYEFFLLPPFFLATWLEQSRETGPRID